MERLGRLSGLGGLIFLGCGGAKPAPTAPGPPASSVVVKEPVEKADLSPVATPPELFALGRLKRPGPIVDTLGSWAGLPAKVRTLLAGELHGFDAVIAWDAPVEVALALPVGGRQQGIRSVVSVGLSSLERALEIARDHGLSPERLQPEVYGFSGPGGLRCAAGPALGSASARLVCGERRAEVEELFAYATRGLPNENLGNRDLELEVRAEPLRRRFSSELAGTRLFAGFLLRQAELDNARFDRALADAAYSIADELVLEVEDTDSIDIGGSLDDAGKHVSLEIAWKFRSTRSWFAGLANELSRRPGPPPPVFARLPGDATSAGYTVDVTTDRTTPVRAAATDLIDAYLELEKIGKNTRERAKRLAAKLLGLTAASVQSAGNLAPGNHTETEKNLGWRLTRIELPFAEIERMLEDIHALARDRELWKALGKRFEFDTKVVPKSELAPLRGKGIPAGARALTITIPVELAEKVQRGAKSSPKAPSKQPVSFVLVAAPDGQGATVIVVSSQKKDASERLTAFLGEGGKRLAARGDLAALQSSRALHGHFFTLLGLLDSLPGGANPEKTAALLPNHGETPMIASYTISSGPPLAWSVTATIPSGVLADVPGLVAAIAGSP